jgi:hypothetical protein
MHDHAAASAELGAWAPDGSTRRPTGELRWLSRMSCAGGSPSAQAVRVLDARARVFEGPRGPRDREWPLEAQAQTNMAPDPSEKLSSKTTRPNGFETNSPHGLFKESRYKWRSRSRPSTSTEERVQHWRLIISHDVCRTTGIKLRSPEGARSATEGFVSFNGLVGQPL